MKNEVTGMKFRLIVMNFLQFGVWGAYLISMGTFLFTSGLKEDIGWFYSMQGIVSMFMPAIMGIVADRWIPAQKLLGICHLLGAVFMGAAGYYGMTHADNMVFGELFTLYSLSVAFYMPTLALSNSVAYTALDTVHLDTVKHFPPIRIFGTIGFICAMLTTDFLGLQSGPEQFFLSAGVQVVLGFYSMTLPACPLAERNGQQSMAEALGLKAFTLFGSKKMALFFIFSMLLGVSLQITNAFANPFLSSFKDIPEYASTFGVLHANTLISISQISETLCILLIPFALKRFGIKNVMLIAMLAWVLRFGLLGLGNPGSGVWMFVLSMVVYGVAFDFFNISGSLFVDKETSLDIRSSAQGLFIIMTNGVGATVGTLAAQQVVNHFVYNLGQDASPMDISAGWSSSWFTFATYALIVAVLFAVCFRYKHQPENVK